MEIINEIEHMCAETKSQEHRSKSKSWWFICTLSFCLILYCIVNENSNFNQHHSKRDLRTSFTSISPNETHHEVKKNMRMALVRPFSLIEADSLPSSFDVWNEFLPCSKQTIKMKQQNQNNTESDMNNAQSEQVVHVDLYLSFSQSYANSRHARKAANNVLQQMKSSEWGKCFQNFYTIEADIPADEDLYEPTLKNDEMWVNGPNRQFISAFRSIQSQNIYNGHDYDVMFVMESDSVPVKQFWIDSLTTEVQQHHPFALLGSKYDGDSWNKLRHQLPISLLHHINGNAVYNLTHPLLLNIINQIESEANTHFNSIPYDYRISQIIYEGSHGLAPKLSPKTLRSNPNIMDDNDTADNTKLFNKWWRKYGDSMDGNHPMKESRVISNFAATNILPHQLDDASIIHGARHFLPWDGKDEITLVVSEWYNGLSSQLLSDIDSSEHPFKSITLMLPPDVNKDDLPEISATSLPVDATYRTSVDFMDICEAPVKTEWFMMTNCYHSLDTSVDLLFTLDEPHKPVISYTPADENHCFQHKGCKDVHRQGRKIHTSLNMVVEDMDMLFHTRERDEFCEYWKKHNEESHDANIELYRKGGLKSDYREKKGPSATSYVAYLQKKRKLHQLYEFSDRTMYGGRDLFDKVFPAEEAQSGHDSKLLDRRMKRTRDASPVHSIGASVDPPSPTAFAFSPSPSPASSPQQKAARSDEEETQQQTTTKTSLQEAKEEELISNEEKIKEDGEDENACQEYCYALAIPWHDADASAKQKCQWKYSCSGCRECGTAFPNVKDDNTFQSTDETNKISSKIIESHEHEKAFLMVPVMASILAVSMVVAIGFYAWKRHQQNYFSIDTSFENESTDESTSSFSFKV